SQENAAFAQTITNAELLKKMEAQEKVVIVDVREADEFASGHIPGAIAIPYGELTGRLAELNQDEELYIVCRTGNRSDMACKLLAEKGFSKLINVLPGMSGWSGPVQSGE
ncbi:rhodanese-like domain-containing protein, partial [Salmonella enterica]|nr:rhodanese-like domain-containing protein [Salmonella enterica]